MSLDIGPDRSLSPTIAQEHRPEQAASPIDPGIAALQQVTNAAVTQAYGRENADVAGARLEELGQFDRERAVEVVRDNPEALGPVQNPVAAERLAAALPSIYASTDIARPPITAETLERDGVTYAVQGLDRVRDEQGAPHLVGSSNEQAVAYLDREGHWPYTIHIRAFHPDAEFVTGYRGDNRKFSTSLEAGTTSRIHQVVNLDTGPDTLTSPRPISDPSHHDWYPDRFNDRAAQPTGRAYNYDVQNNTFGNEIHSFSTEFAGHNALIDSSPDINVNGSFSITESIETGKLHISARVNGDHFPNTEAFIVDRFGTALFIGTATKTGNELQSLSGDNHRAIFKSDFAANINSQGHFTGVTYRGRDYSVNQWNDFVRDHPQ